LCTGSGCLAILAALAFPNASVVGTDIMPDALKVAQRNAASYRLEDRISFRHGDLFVRLHDQKFNLILANPPYVRAESVDEFPPEYQAEPRVAHDGGKDGMEVVRDILASAHLHLEPHGMLVVEVGQGRPILEAEYPELPFLWLDTEESEGEVFALAARDLEQLHEHARG
jgi:ribosomal protein L3 glutamine methyltransferase